MDPRKDPDARRKWYRAWTAVRTWYDIDQDPPQYIYQNEYLFEYLASNRVAGRFLPCWLSYGVKTRREIMRLVDGVVAELKAEESDAH